MFKTSILRKNPRWNSHSAITFMVANKSISTMPFLLGRWICLPTGRANFGPSSFQRTVHQDEGEDRGTTTAKRARGRGSSESAERVAVKVGSGRCSGGHLERAKEETVELIIVTCIALFLIVRIPLHTYMHSISFKSVCFSLPFQTIPDQQHYWIYVTKYL